jgi:branched-chain amino acid transport system permease protein
MNNASDSMALSNHVNKKRKVKGVLLSAGFAFALILFGPYFLDNYTVNILVRAFVYAATALTVNILWGYTGILTFGQSAFFGVGAYAAGLLFTHYGFSYGIAALALCLGILASGLLAWLVGWISFYQGASPLYVAIVTLAFPIVLVQLLYSGGTFTGSSSGLVGYETFDLSVHAWFSLAGGFLVLVTLGAWFLVNSDFGRVLRAIRENEQRCAYLGINAPRIKTLLMVAMAAVASVAGFIYAGYTVVVAPEIAGFVFGTELVIWVALGGRGTLLGPVIATLGIDLITAYLSGSFPYIWKMFVGILFVSVIVLLPQGIFPPIWSFFGRRFKRKDSTGIVPQVVSSEMGVVKNHAATQGRPFVLKVSSLGKNFGSLKVLEDISFSVKEGELLSIVGPNGAGKTTLMRCLSDGTERTFGDIQIEGHVIHRDAPYELVSLGLGRSFQTTSLYETLTVYECLRLARYGLDKPSMTTTLTSLSLPGPAMRVMSATGLDADLACEAKNLSHGKKRALELTMVLALEPRVLLLDEPTAGLTKPERTLIGSILTDLSSNHGISVVLIEHDLDFVREISTRIMVLTQGKILLDGPVDEVVNSDLVKTVYSGHG